MKNLRPTVAAIAAALLAGSALAGTAGAVEPTTRYNDAVQSCLAQLDEHLDLAAATRVRHLVNLRQNTGIGKVMEIDTSVFQPGRVRSYSTYCVADGSNVPVKFRVDEA